MTNKIYYYKLISPFEEDVTKDCKLSITDIDGNFYNLKRMGIKDGYVDSENKTIILERYSGDSITIDASDIYDGIIKSSKEKNVKNIDFSFNSSANTVEVKWEDGTLESGSTSAHSFSFDSIFSPDISTDCTLIGEGNTFSPLRINPNEKTGYFKSVKSLVNIVAGQSLPVSGLSYADRYVTYERTSDYGLIYDEHAMKNISAMLESAGSVWRVPTKEDWDKLLNSLEPCMYQNHDTEGSQDKLGKYAGALLKSSDKWDESIDKGTTCTYGCECGCSANTDSLSAVTVSPEGVGYNNFDIYPAGWVDQTSHFHTSDNFGKEAGLWCNTSAETLNQWYIKIFGYNNATVAQDVVCPDAFSSIRLVKDYNGSNAIGAEEILGNSYNTAAFGKHNGVTVNQVWTLSNMMAKPDVCDNTHYYIPSGLTETVDSYNVYYLNEWNGCSWIRKKLSDGDLIVVNDASTVEAGDENDSEFIVMEDSTKTQKLVSTDTLSYDRIVEKVNNTLNSLSGMVESVSGAVNTKLSITASPWEYYGNGIRTKNASNVPIGYGSVAEGSNNISKGKYSYVNGEYNITNNEAEQAGGKYNASVSSNSVSEETFFTIGNGTSDDARSNAIEVKRNGDMYITGVGGYKYEFGEVPADAQSVQKVIHNLQEIAGTAQYLSGSTDTAVVYPNNDTKVITAKVKIAKDVPNHNIITVQQDAGLYADVRLGYDALTNKLTLYTSNLNSGYTETEIQLSSVQVFKNMYYDAASESIVMEYSPLSAQTETDQVSIPLSGLIEEWAVEEKHMGGIQLLKQRNAKDGKDLLTANAVLSDMKTNILQIDENGGMFVEGSGITDNSEKIYSLSGSVSGNSLEIKDASDKIDSLSGAMIDDELIMVKSFITVANSAGFNDNLEYVKKSGDTILSAATNLSEADTALSNGINKSRTDISSINTNIDSIKSDIIKFSGEVIDDEFIIAKSFNNIKNAVGLNINAEYSVESGDTILSAATNLSEADTALSKNIHNLYDTSNEISGKIESVSAETQMNPWMYYNGNKEKGVVTKYGGCIASGSLSVAEGGGTSAIGNVSHAEGNSSHAVGDITHAEGLGTYASGTTSHAEGQGTYASGNISHAEGNISHSVGEISHAEGNNTWANGYISHSEGDGTYAIGYFSHSEGQRTYASGTTSHAEGYGTYAIGNSSHVEGNSSHAVGDISHAEGNNTWANGMYSHAEGNNTIANGTYSHAEGNSSSALTEASHAEGYNTQANGLYSHAEGDNTKSIGYNSHAEGKNTQSYGHASHTEGLDTYAREQSAHAEGIGTIANGFSSHAEGIDTQANEKSSHAEGSGTTANGTYSHAEGYGTITNNPYEHAEGFSNSSTKSDVSSASTLSSIGIGNSTNAVEVKQNGDVYIINLGNYNGKENNQNSSLSLQSLIANTKLDLSTLSGEVSDNELVTSSAINQLNDSAGFDERGKYVVHSGDTILKSAYSLENADFLLSKAINDNYVSQKKDVSSVTVSIEAETERAKTAETSLNNSLFSNAKYSSSAKTITFYDNSGKLLSTIDASDFIKDGMVNTVSVTGGNLLITFNTDSGKENISIPITQIFDAGSYYNKTDVNTIIQNQNTLIGTKLPISGSPWEYQSTGTVLKGFNNFSFADAAVAEGINNNSYGKYSHSEGTNTVASGESSHAEGTFVTATGKGAHAEGRSTSGNGWYSHAEGMSTVTQNNYEHAEGMYNVSTTSSVLSASTLHSIGIGTSDKSLNGEETKKNGDKYLYGIGGYTGNNFTSSITVQNVVNSKADKPIINRVTGTSVTQALIANRFYKFSTALTALTVTLVASSNTTYLDEYMFEFTSDANTAATLTVPSTVKWMSNITPVIEKGKTYQVSIMNNIAVIGGLTI